MSVHTSTGGGGYLPSQMGGVPTFPGLDGGYLPWWMVPTSAGGVSTLAGGTYLGRGSYLGRGRGYLPWQGRGVPTLEGGTYLGRGILTLAGWVPTFPGRTSIACACGGWYASLLHSRRRTFLLFKIDIEEFQNRQKIKAVLLSLGNIGILVEFQNSKKTTSTAIYFYNRIVLMGNIPRKSADSPNSEVVQIH